MSGAAGADGQAGVRPVESSDGRRRRLSDAGVAIIGAAGSRAAVVVAIAIWARYLHYHGHRAALAAGLRGLLVKPYTHRDAVWFAAIARHGYDRTDSVAFFPLYPLLMRAVSVVLADKVFVAGMVVSLVAYGLAMLVLYRLTAELADTRTAAIAVTLISVAPVAFVFNAVYSESLFLLFTVLCLWLAQTRRWALAGLAGLAATLTRSSGLLLFLPLLVLYGSQQGWTWRSIRPRWPRDLRLAWTLLIPAGLLAYMTYLWARFGDPRLFSQAERRHWKRVLDWPWADAGRGARAAVSTLESLAAHHANLLGGLKPGGYAEIKLVLMVLPVLALVFAVAMIVLGWRRLPAAYTLFAVLSVAFPLFFPSSLYPLWSYPRFALVAFPLFITLAMVLKKRPVLRWSIVAVSFVVMLWLAGAFGIGTAAL